MLKPVHWDLGHRKMAAQFCCGYATAAILPVLCYVFVHKFLFNPHFDIEPDYIIRKPIRHKIQWCNLRRKILSTFHIRVDHRSVRPFPIEKNRAKMPTNARNSPFPWGTWTYLTHECLSPPHSPWQLDRCTHFHTTTQQSPHWLQWNAANSPPPSCLFPFDDHHQNLIHPYQARPHSPPQTASESNQPFCHNSHVRMDRRVDECSITLALCSLFWYRAKRY